MIGIKIKVKKPSGYSNVYPRNAVILDKLIYEYTTNIITTAYLIEYDNGEIDVIEPLKILSINH